MRRCGIVRFAGQLAAVLRNVIEKSPSSGISLGEVEAKLKEGIQITETTNSGIIRKEKESEEKNKLPTSWKELLLPEVNDAHYVSGEILYPCNWEETMRRVVTEIPREGVAENEFIHRIMEIESNFSPSSISFGGPFSKWVQDRFSHFINVSRSVAAGVPIYRRREEPLPAQAECIHRALQLLGRGKLPVYTNMRLIIPLIPAAISPRKGNWMQFVESEEVRRYFDVNVEAFVRLSPHRTPSTICVDATSVDVAKIDEILAENGLSDSLCAVKVFRRVEDPSRSLDDVVVESFLDPEHAIGAVITSMWKSNNTNLFILCGDTEKDKYKNALADLLGNDGMKVKIFTPSVGISLELETN